MPRLLLAGYFGCGNLGDEAILAGAIAGLRRVLPDCELVALSGAPAETRAVHGIAAHPRGVRVAHAAIADCDAVLLGGGGLFQDITSWRSPLYYLALLDAAQRAHKRTILFAQGVGPLQRRWIRRLCRRVLNRVDLITVRDAASAEVLREMGVTEPPVHRTADLALLLDPAPADPVTGGALVVCPRPWAGDDWVRPLARALRGVALALNRLVLAIPFDTKRDHNIAGAVAAAAGGRVAAPPAQPAELLGALQSAELVVGVRLHALMLGALAGVPVIGLSYDPKVSAFLEALGRPSVAQLPHLDENAIGQALLDATKHRETIVAQQQQRLADLRARAEKNIDLVAEVLELARAAG